MYGRIWFKLFCWKRTGRNNIFQNFKKQLRCSRQRRFFSYQDYVGKVIKCKHLDKITILPIELTVNYFHYGDNLTIFSFSRLNEVIQSIDFKANEDKDNKGCFNVNTVWVKEVKSLRDVDTIKYLLSFPAIIESMKVIGNSAASHIESRGFDESAQYLKSQIKKILL